MQNKCMNMDHQEMQGMIHGGMNNQDKLVFPNSLINCHILTGLNHGHNNATLLSQNNDFNSMRQIQNQVTMFSYYTSLMILYMILTFYLLLCLGFVL